jgi:hypothetical protein
MEDFISLFLRITCHLKYFEIINETTPKMHDFILEFHNIKLYFVSLVIYGMKRNLLIPMLVSWGFIYLKTLHIRFNLDETHLLSFFINSLPCYKKFYVMTHLLKMKLPLRLVVT